jgi:glycosyltransferase involved in cell wall biosynthesis
MRRGAMPELIRNGETGFLCDTRDDMLAAIEKLDELSPAACRREALARFSIDKVRAGYHELYQQAMTGTTW